MDRVRKRDIPWHGPQSKGLSVIPFLPPLWMKSMQMNPLSADFRSRGHDNQNEWSSAKPGPTACRLPPPRVTDCLLSSCIFMLPSLSLNNHAWSTYDIPWNYLRDTPVSVCIVNLCVHLCVYVTLTSIGNFGTMFVLTVTHNKTQQWVTSVI